MTRIPRTTRGQRIQESYVKRLTNRAKIDYVEEVGRIEKTSPLKNEASEGHLLAYEHYYEMMDDLKRSFKRFYYEERNAFSPLHDNDEKLANDLVYLIEKYNEAMSSLRPFEQISGIRHTEAFHHIFHLYEDDFNKIGITEKDDYSLQLNIEHFIDYLQTEEHTQLQFIRQFKAKLIQEYYHIFQQSPLRQESIVKGLIIEEKG